MPRAERSSTTPTRGSLRRRFRLRSSGGLRRAPSVASRRRSNQCRRDEEETEMPSRPPTATWLETGHGRTRTGPADQASRHTSSRLPRPPVVRQDVKKVSTAGRHGGRGESPHGGTASAPSAREETTLGSVERRWRSARRGGRAAAPGGHELNRGARPGKLTEPRPTMTLQAQMDMGGIGRFRRSGPLFGDHVARFALSETD